MIHQLAKPVIWWSLFIFIYYLQRLGTVFIDRHAIEAKPVSTSLHGEIDID